MSSLSYFTDEQLLEHVLKTFSRPLIEEYDSSEGTKNIATVLSKLLELSGPLSHQAVYSWKQRALADNGFKALVKHGTIFVILLVLSLKGVLKKALEVDAEKVRKLNKYVSCRLLFCGVRVNMLFILFISFPK